MTLDIVLLLLGGGLIAGFVNTVAGGGSVITLPILMEGAGLSASVANGTNRIAILMQNIAAVAGFQRGGAVPWARVRPLLVPAVLGAVLGAWTATRLSPATMKTVFAFVIVLVAASVLVRPSRWLSEGEPRLGGVARHAAFFGIGFYGGFVQAGVGFLLLAGLVLGGGLDLVRGNAAKVLIVLVYTVVALLAFFLAGHVDLAKGLVLGAGNVGGALLATRLAIRKGAAWIRWVLVVAALAAAGKMLFFH